MKKGIKLQRKVCFLFACILFWSTLGCAGGAPDLSGSVLPEPTVTATPIQLISPTKTPAAPLVWVSPDLPSSFIASIQLPTDWILIQTRQDATLRIEIGNENPISDWVYALVAPFPTVNDGIASADLIDLWLFGSDEGAPNRQLLVSRNTLAVFSRLWGIPSSQTVIAVPENQLLGRAWSEKNNWVIIPFEEIQPEWKVLEVDGISPIHKEFGAELYPLTIPISIFGDHSALVAELNKITDGDSTAIAPTSNRDPQRLTTLIMTGVTALVRATAAVMQYRGMTYPGQDIREWLRQADLTHINNEVPFSPRCPRHSTRVDDLTFCSTPETIELLDDIGADIIELSGDHLADWGPEAMLYTLNLYKERGWGVYGGGENLEAARKPLLIEHNGSRLAFLGCNAKGPGYARAAENFPGAALCDMDQFQSEIQRLRADDYLPIVTFQHHEVYTYGINPALQTDFRKAAQAGALIVSGSQAHQPHAMEFYEGAFIHYGLGNLFFDQYDEGFPMRQAFIDRHVFYNNRHINTELLTVMFVDYARPRPMTSEERRDLLEVIFNASGW